MNFDFLKKIVTFGSDEIAGRYLPPPEKLVFGYKGSGGSTAERWIDMPDAQVMVDKAMQEKGVLGLGKKFATRDEAEKEVAARLYNARIGIKTS